MNERNRHRRDRVFLFALGVALMGILPGAALAQSTDAVPSDGDVQEGVPEITSPYGAYLAGLSATLSRDMSVAADYMATALQGAPDDPEILNRSFALFLGEGRLEEARPLAHRLMELNQDHLTANLLLSIDGIADEDWDAALNYLEAMPERGLGSLLKPLLSAWIAFGRGDQEEARQILDAELSNNGVEFLRHVHGALVAELSGDVEAASLAYEKAIATSSAPSLRLAWIAGNFYERHGRSEEAAALYRRFVDDGRGATIMAPLLRRAEKGEEANAAIADVRAGAAEVLFNFASLLNQERAGDLALMTVRLALHLRSDFPVAQVLLGEILQDQQRAQAAIEAYRAVPVSSPFKPVVRLRIADELDRLDEIELALAELDELARELPDQYEPHYRKGNLLRARDRFEEAVRAYDTAVELLGEPAPRHWSILYFRGVALERSKQWNRAEADFLKALELEPEQPFVMNYLAYSWVEQERNLDEAKAMLVRAVELRPEDGYIIDSLGWVYYRLGEYENAVKYLERAVELQPQDPVINDHLGDAFWRKDRRAEARFQWRRSLSLDPEEDNIPVIEEKILNGVDLSAEDI